MNSEAIRRTAIHWVDENGDHIVESPLCDMVTGVGDTESEAQQIFEELLQDYIDDLKEGKVHRKVGRPAKGKVNFSIQVDPDVREAVTKMAKEIHISQGEAIEFLLGYWTRSQKV